MARGNTENVVLGALTFYIAPYEGGELDGLKTYCTDENLIGWTQGGSTFTYTPEIKNIEDDKGMVRRTFMSKANAELKTGFLTIDTQSISEILSVGKFTPGEAGGVNKLELGGGKSALKRYIVVGEYEDDGDDGGHNLRVGMVATNTAALELIFKADQETVPNVTFSAASNGVNDTIVVIEEDKPAA